MVSLSPAVAMARGTFGQSLTQKLTLNNQTSAPFPFEMIANDVVVKDGKRQFVEAGQLLHSIAATAVFSRKTGVIPPYGDASVEVGLTVPEATDIRAVVVIFQGRQPLPAEKGSVGMTASLGALITFNLTDHVQVDAGSVRVATESAGTQISLPLTNSGIEPAVAEGTAVFLDSRGALSAKVPFAGQRLLPGEKLDFNTEYTGELRPGTYKVLCSFEFEGKTLTAEGSYTSP
jgi:hypothetical protein